jgi:hypothetical protein
MDKESPKTQPVTEALDTIALIQTLVKDVPSDKVSPSEAIFWVFKALGTYKV